MPPIARPDPYLGTLFLMTINGRSNDGEAPGAAFTEISGLNATHDVTEYREGAEDITPRKMPGLVKYENLVCKRGVTGDLIFWNWLLAGIQGTVDRLDGSIMLLNENREEVMRWNFRRAFPVKYMGPSLNAANSEIAMDTVEICHEGLEIDI